jgi:hypothetical protein
MWKGELVAALLLVAGIVTRWIRNRRLETGFPFVYVNQDGSARELSPGECAYLSTEFSLGDGARPYVKSTYKSRDGWGSQSGYIARHRIPARIAILPVNPNYDVLREQEGTNTLEILKVAGLVVSSKDEHGTQTPDRNVSFEERYETARRQILADQQRAEALARA